MAEKKREREEEVVVVKYKLANPRTGNLDPVAPFQKEKANRDAGFDLTAVAFLKEKNGVEFYTTDVSMEIPPGYYAHIYLRSSTPAETGYMLANSVAIMDNEYRGPYILQLVKHNHESPMLQLPARIAQVIFVKQENVKLVETKEELSVTERGTGAFGSTGK